MSRWAPHDSSAVTFQTLLGCVARLLPQRAQLLQAGTEFLSSSLPSHTSALYDVALCCFMTVQS